MGQHRLVTHDLVIEANGESRTHKAWAAHIGLTPNGLRARICAGMTPEEAVTRPRRRRAKNRPSGASLVEDLDLPWEVSDQSWYIVARHPAGLTLEQVGEVFGLTRERIRQIEEKALKKLLRSPTRAAVLRELLELSLERETAPRWPSDGGRA